MTGALPAGTTTSGVLPVASSPGGAQVINAVKFPDSG